MLAVTWTAVQVRRAVDSALSEAEVYDAEFNLLRPKATIYLRDNAVIQNADLFGVTIQRRGTNILVTSNYFADMNLRQAHLGRNLTKLTPDIYESNPDFPLLRIPGIETISLTVEGVTMLKTPNVTVSYCFFSSAGEYWREQYLTHKQINR